MKLGIVVNFTHAVLAALERKVQYMQLHRRNFSNAQLATLQWIVGRP